MKLQTLPATAVIEGVVIPDAMLDAKDMASMNFAREEFDNLVKIILPLVEPLLRHKGNGLASDIDRHIEHIRLFSGNFCWKHRHLGAMHDAVNVGGVR